MRALVRLGVIGVTIGAVGLTACTSGTGMSGSVLSAPKPAPPAFRLVSFDSCAEAVSGIRAAAKKAVGPYGFNYGGFLWSTTAGAMADSPAMKADARAVPAPEAGVDYSGTNTHEVGVDEPDLVKTDGRRIVTVSGGALKVVDVAHRALSSTVDLTVATSLGQVGYQPESLLLSGDRALVLERPSYLYRGTPLPMVGGPAIDLKYPVGPDAGYNTARLLLVDLSGTPHVVSSMVVDGSVADARQVGAVARVVLRSAPHITFPQPVAPLGDPVAPLRKEPSPEVAQAQRIAANQAIIDAAPIEDFLPRIDTTTAGGTTRAAIDCSAVSRPPVYSGTSFTTVLTFDLATAALGDGRAATLAADVDTVYSNGSSLYVASTQQPPAVPAVPAGPANPGAIPMAPDATSVYRFDTSSPGRPTFAAGGTVPGRLLSQYALSEWDGKLRLATTSNENGKPTTGVYVLAQQGRVLAQIGSVGGLGKGETVQSVRFIGTTGYVVTFRRTDPQ